MFLPLEEEKDNVIRFYNADTKSVIGEYNTGSQVCQILWNKYEKEIISSHGNSKIQYVFGHIQK